MLLTKLLRFHKDMTFCREDISIEKIIGLELDLRSSIEKLLHLGLCTEVDEDCSALAIIEHKLNEKKLGEKGYKAMDLREDESEMEKKKTFLDSYGEICMEIYQR